MHSFFCAFLGVYGRFALHPDRGYDREKYSFCFGEEKGKANEVR